MLKRASVADVKDGRVMKGAALVIVAMRFYPRFLRKELVDEYRRELAPPAALFTEFKAKDRKIANHNSSFYQVDYEARFDLSAKGRESLAELAKWSLERDVILICQCRDFDRCHCDLLLLWARERYGADAAQPIFDYPVFAARLKDPAFPMPPASPSSPASEAEPEHAPEFDSD